MHMKLPEAVAVLAQRASLLATGEVAPSREPLHPPVALLLYSTALHAAPSALRTQIMVEEAAPGARTAFVSILARCTQLTNVCHSPKLFSMTCKSLLLLHDCGVWGEDVRRAQAHFIGRVRTAGMKRLDLQAVTDLCLLIAAFRRGDDQRRPRAWYIAMARLREDCREDALSMGMDIPIAGRVAGSVHTMQDTLGPELQAAVVHAGCAFVAEGASRVRVIKAPDIADYLVAVAHLQLPVPEDVLKVCALQVRGTKVCEAIPQDFSVFECAESFHVGNLPPE
jgi:hypothetical protein